MVLLKHLSFETELNTNKSATIGITWCLNTTKLSREVHASTAGPRRLSKFKKFHRAAHDPSLSFSLSIRLCTMPCGGAKLFVGCSHHWRRLAAVTKAYGMFTLFIKPAILACHIFIISLFLPIFCIVAFKTSFIQRNFGRPEYICRPTLMCYENSFSPLINQQWS